MTDNEKRLLGLIRDSKDPMKATETAIQIICKHIEGIAQMVGDNNG